MAVDSWSSSLALPPTASLRYLFLAIAAIPPLPAPVSPPVSNAAPYIPNFGSGSSSPPPTSFQPFDPIAGSFRPSIAVIIGVVTTMFSLTFLLLLYAKHCKRNNSRPEDVPLPPGLHGRTSGVDRAIIDALPMFPFASLQGLKEGLECAVCLSRFEKNDILRLLPKCKHAFHLECVDEWLNNHSTCPLCRHRVEAEDILIVEEFFPEDIRVCGGEGELQTGSGRKSTGETSSASARNSTGGGLERVPQLFVQRENVIDLTRPKLKPGMDNSNTSIKEGTSRSGSRRKDGGSGRKYPVLLEESLARDEEEELARRFGHRIIVSDVVFQHRWSDFMPSDVLFLSSHRLFGYTERLSTAGLRLPLSTPKRNPQAPRLSAANSSIDPLRLSSSARIDPLRMSSSISNSPGLATLNLPRSYSARIEPPRLSHSSWNEFAPVYSRNSDAVFPQLSSPYRIPYPRRSDRFTSVDLGSSSSAGAVGGFDLEMGIMESTTPRRCTGSNKFNTIKGSRPEGETKGLIERHAMLLKRAFTSGRSDPDGALLSPAYQRSLSEFSRTKRYVDCPKNSPNDRDEKTRRWFSIARRTLNWLTGSDWGKINHSGG